MVQCHTEESAASVVPVDKSISPRTDSGLIIIRLHTSRAIGRRSTVRCSPFLGRACRKPRLVFRPANRRSVSSGNLSDFAVTHATSADHRIRKNVSYYVIDVANNMVQQEFLKFRNFMFYVLSQLTYSPKVKQILFS